MSTKTISIMDDAYEILKKAKLPEESFSDVIRREIKKRSPLDYFGSYKDLDTKKINELRKNMKKGDEKKMREVLKSFA